MIFLVAATEAKLDAKIAKRFGHAQFYLFVNSESYEFSYMNGPGENEPSFDFNKFTQLNIDTVILGNIGPQAFNKLSRLGVPVYSCIGKSVKDAIELVTNSEIEALINPTMKRSVHSGAQGKGAGQGRGGGQGNNRR